MSAKSEVIDGVLSAVDAGTDLTATSPREDKEKRRESSREKDKERERRSRPDIERSKSHKESSKKDRDREREKEHRSPKLAASSFLFSKVRPTDSEISHSSVRRSRSHHHPRTVKLDDSKPSPSDVMGDLGRMLGLSPSSDRISVPYPSFSKTHSKEAVGSREDISTASQVRKVSGSTTGVKANGDPITPDATDLGSAGRKKRSSHRSKSADSAHERRSTTKSRSDGCPPSPPETDVDPPQPAASVARSSRSHRVDSSEIDIIKDERPTKSRVSELSRAESKLSRRKSSSSRASSHSTAVPRTSSSRETLRAHRDSDRLSRTGSMTKSKLSIRSLSHRSSAKKRLDHDYDHDNSRERDRERRHRRRTSSPDSPKDSSPRTPTHLQNMAFPEGTIVEGEKSPESDSRSSRSSLSSARSDASIPNSLSLAFRNGVLSAAPPPLPPPPPPPPILTTQETPRVDYLMQNGGLPQTVSKQFLSVLSQNRIQRTAPNVPPLKGAEYFFTPFFNLLDQYNTVLAKHGSIAVATGHRSVARRLLDRLERVFSRELPQEGCTCLVCERSEYPHHGLNWGEVLEQVSGRANLPSWPPFDIGSLGIKAVSSHIDPDAPPRPSSPINLDPDLNEEFREHYLRQTQKVRQAVDRWMTKCADAPAPPPQEIDDETLTFAILTNLSTDDKPFFNALLTGSRELQPATRAPTPFRKTKSDLIIQTSNSLKRLYSLPTSPRSAETALYLIKYPETHDLLATISAINPSEWEILTSGRFDGFLWSGADTGELSPGGPMSPDRGDGVNSRISFGGSRSASPLQRPYSRSATTTPASFMSSVTVPGPTSSKKAVSVDEEAEIAALNELELEIFNGMEALENAFETLHLHAQNIRNDLRMRAAGLTQSLQMRNRPEILPSSGNSLAPGFDRSVWGIEEEDDGSWADDLDMIAPDDSASNVASNRRQQHKRRQERKTPAPIEEEEED